MLKQLVRQVSAFIDLTLLIQLLVGQGLRTLSAPGWEIFSIMKTNSKAQGDIIQAVKLLIRHNGNLKK